MKGLVLIEHRALGSAAFYMASGETMTYPLTLHDHFPTTLWESTSSQTPLDEILVKLESMQSSTNSHLAEVSSYWDKLEARFKEAAARAGLLPYNQFSNDIVDTCWPALFVEAVWKSGAPAARRAGDWTVAETVSSLPMRHTIDTVSVWVIRDSNMVKSQSREAAQEMLSALTEETATSESAIQQLLRKRDDLTREFDEFRKAVEKVLRE